MTAQQIAPGDRVRIAPGRTVAGVWGGGWATVVIVGEHGVTVDPGKPFGRMMYPHVMVTDVEKAVKP